MIRIMLVPLTKYGVLEFVDNLGTEIESVLKEADIRDIDIVVWPDVVKPPIKCFSWNRIQYHANCVAKYLKELFQMVGIVGETLIVGIGYLDGFEYGLNFVFGEALPEYKVAVVFTKRLRPEFYGEPANYNLYFERVVKEVIHEIGHLFRLEHCSGNCVMKFSNSIYEVDEKPKRYCELCKVRVREHYMSSTK